MENTPSTIKVNDFVWAKLARYAPWPAIVMTPDPLAPRPKHKNSHWIYFFGSHDYAWVEEQHIKPFKAYRDQYKATYKQIAIQEAVEELEKIIENLKKDPHYKIKFIKYTRKERRRSTRSRMSSASSIESRKRPLKEKNTSDSRKKSRSSSIDSDSDRGVVSIHDFNRPVVISPKTFGFIAANICDEGIIKNVIKFGHRSQVWSSSLAMCEELQEYADRLDASFKICKTRRELVKNCDVIFNHQTDPEQVRIIIKELGACDENDDLLDGKAYVEMTTLCPEASIEHSKWIESKGATYIEAMVQGGIAEANRGEIIIIAAGKLPPFDECSSCFKAMGKTAILLGSTGSAAKAQMLLEAMKGVFLAGFTELFALADRWGVGQDDFLHLYKSTPLASTYIINKADIILGRGYSETDEPVHILQRNFAQLREHTHILRYPIPLASSAFEIFKHARRLGYDNLDSSSIYTRTRY